MDRVRWVVVIKSWSGFFGWSHRHVKNGWLGEPLWDIRHLNFGSRKEAEKYIHTTGCDCCHRPPKKIVPNKWYETGYADKLKLRPEPKKPTSKWRRLPKRWTRTKGKRSST